MKKVLLIALLGTVALWVSARAFAAHSDLTCLNCHAPHHAGDPADPTLYGVPLWNTANAHALPTFDLYTSKTFAALGTDISPPDGSSKLCLGCHDGSATGGVPAGSTKVFGIADLARSHPISFTYDGILAAKAPKSLKDPSVMSGFGKSITEDLLDSKSKMQCTSCHDVHMGGKGVNHLRWELTVTTANKYPEVTMCNTCHNK
jgi:hypothetical protein